MAVDPTDDEFGVLRQFYSQIEAVLDPVEVAKLLWQDGLLTTNQLGNAEQSLDEAFKCFYFIALWV